MRIRSQLIIFMFLRTILNTMHRMVYPFLAVFARGLGVPITTFSFILTARSFIGMLTPVLGSFVDHRGRRFGMLAGILLFTAGMGLVALVPSFATFGIALILAILGKYLFDPSMQAYFVWRMVPHAAPTQPVTASVQNVRSVLTNIPALAGISIALWASAANELVNLIFGVWLEDSFGLKIAALAGASAIIGLSELGGEGLVALTTDRLGKPRALALGLTGNIAASLLLPFVGRTEIGALVGLFLFYITFEYVLVSHIPLMTEVMPGLRATLLSFNVMGHSLGRMIGALLATFIYQKFGFLPVTWIAVAFNMFALLALAELTQRLVILPRILAFFGGTERIES
jgi:predicted MFS family arabinose efflux permease